MNPPDGNPLLTREDAQQAVMAVFEWLVPAYEAGGARVSLGVYRLWRDSGYAFGALAVGLVADRFGLQIGFWLVIALMAGCGLVIALVMYETQPERRSVFPVWERDPRLE